MAIFYRRKLVAMKLCSRKEEAGRDCKKTLRSVEENRDFYARYRLHTASTDGL
jgi:hypothetical protein